MLWNMKYQMLPSNFLFLVLPLLFVFPSVNVYGVSGMAKARGGVLANWTSHFESTPG